MHLIGSLRLKVAILVGTFLMNTKMLKEAGDDLCQAAAVAVYNTSILTFVYIFNYLFTKCLLLINIS